MLNAFKNNFFGGTRSNRFLIEGNIPFSSGGKFGPFHVRSTIMPQVMSTTLSYDFFGRKFHYPGEKQYSTWVFTVLDDTGEYDLWKSFQRWQNTINNNNTNVSNVLTSTSTYKADNWYIKHLDLNESTILKSFRLHGCWPAQVGQISLNMGQPNTFSTFQVMIVFDMMEISGAGTQITNR